MKLMRFPLHFLYSKNKDLKSLKEKLVLTTHTPEAAGNEKHDIRLLENLGFFCGIPFEEVRKITGIKDNEFNHTLVALRLAKISNGVSKIHGEVANKMWNKFEGICPIISITNAQNKKYWADFDLDRALRREEDEILVARKKELKQQLFNLVAVKSCTSLKLILEHLVQYLLYLKHMVNLM